MGWLPVHVPVKAFAEAAGGQVWIGSGILRNQLDAGSGSEGTGVVILHGNKMANVGAGAEQDWKREYILDLSTTTPVSAPGVWNYESGVFTLLGHPKAIVQVIGTTNNLYRIEVAQGADTWVILNNANITGNTTGSPFKLNNNAKVKLILTNGSDNSLISANGAGLQDIDNTTLTIEGNDIVDPLGIS